MRNVKPVKLKDLTFNGEKIYIQSMLNVRADNIEGNVKQAVALEKAGCDIIRVAIPDMEAVQLISAIKKGNIRTFGSGYSLRLQACAGFYFRGN